MALPDFFKQRHAASSIFWARAGAGRQEFNRGAVIANNAGHCGEVYDWGADFPKFVYFHLDLLWSTAPANGPLLFHWWPSYDNSNFPGTGSTKRPAANTALTGAEYNTVRHVIPLVHTLQIKNVTNGPYESSGFFRLPARYGAPIIFNLSGGSIANNNNGVVIRMIGSDQQITDTQ